MTALDAEVSCPACGRQGLQIFHEEPSIPAHSCLLLDSLDEAKSFPRGALRLGFCDGCGFITNTRFDESLNQYSQRYEETQGFSERFNAFARDLAQRWVDKYDLQGKNVLEIGCGKGEFLVMMLEAGAGAGIGIDPSAKPERHSSDVIDRIEWITDLYDERYSHLAADAVVCRHTLEHIAPVGDFMRSVRRAIGDRTDTIVLFELPDVLRVLREVAFWDVYYEHCSYFSAGSLARLFRATGFEVIDLALDYDDQYILIEARPSSTPAPDSRLPLEDDMQAMRAGVEHFATGFQSIIDHWRDDLRGLRAGGGRAVIWGAGSKGVSFLTNLEAHDEIEFAVDINPFKHGMYMAGTGHQIVGPEFLLEHRPDKVIVMNPVYLDEVGRDLERLGVEASVVAV